MAPKVPRKRPASEIAQAAQFEEEFEEATTTPQSNLDSSHSLQDPTAATTDVYVPEAELVCQLQGHGLVMRNGKLGPVCIRGAATVVDNSCKNSVAIVTAGDDGSIRLWDAETGEFCRDLRCSNDSADARLLSLTKFHSGHRILTTHCDGTACVFEVGSGKQVAKFGEPGSPAVLSGAIYADQERLVIINAAGEFRFWSLAPGRANVPIAGGSNTATAIAMFPGDRNIAVGTSSGKVHIWCCQTGKCTKEINASSNPVSILIIFPDGSKVLTASEADNFVSIWGVEDVQLLGFGSRVLSAVASRCGGRVVTGEEKGLLKVWDARSGSMLFCWSASSALQAAVFACAFLSETRLLATGEWGASVWELPQVACSTTPPSLVNSSDVLDIAATGIASPEVKQRGSGVRVSFSLSPTST
mmetsp:Transcript_33586/g.53608  ORF Transcript_33586/g.53608 Transcript_33586/m.53608 type:complete len:415 (+) Transcript_33586:25-1269(+)